MLYAKTSFVWTWPRSQSVLLELVCTLLTLILWLAPVLENHCVWMYQGYPESSFYFGMVKNRDNVTVVTTSQLSRSRARVNVVLRSKLSFVNFCCEKHSYKVVRFSSDQISPEDIYHKVCAVNEQNFTIGNRSLQWCLNHLLSKIVEEMFVVRVGVVLIWLKGLMGN